MQMHVLGSSRTITIGYVPNAREPLQSSLPGGLSPTGKDARGAPPGPWTAREGFLDDPPERPGLDTYVFLQNGRSAFAPSTLGKPFGRNCRLMGCDCG